jgi:RHS repeat-associated protein
VPSWASGASSDTLTYSYTNNNQLTGVTHTNGSFSSESFSWDSNGNQTGTGYTTTTANEQTASPGYTYGYDNAGEMTSMTQTSSGNVWTYGYDFRGLMVTAVEKTSGGTTLESVTYTYDALDNRIGMDENSTQTWTLYDRGNAVMDLNSSGSLIMRYLWGPTGVIARQTSGGTVSWYLADHLGTVRDLINNSGAIIDHVDFSAFGTVLGETSPTSGDRMTGFAMLERDTATGLNLAVYREGNPGTGRWGNTDPLGFAAGDSNLYRYTANAPVDATDPAGLEVILYPRPIAYGGFHIDIVAYDPVSDTGWMFSGGGPGDVAYANGGGPYGTGVLKPIVPSKNPFNSHPDLGVPGKNLPYPLKQGLRLNPGKLRTYSQQLAAFNKAYGTLQQIQKYNAIYGPNSNTYACQLLRLTGISTLPLDELEPSFSHPGWNSPAYGGRRSPYDQFGRPRPTRKRPAETTMDSRK